MKQKTLPFALEWSSRTQEHRVALSTRLMVVSRKPVHDSECKKSRIVS